MDVIPAIDLLAGQCVRLLRGDFKQTVVYPFDPLELARRYRDAGLRRLHVVDLDGARSGVQANRDAIRNLVAQTQMLIQLGGGIRDEATIKAWFSAGVARCVIGSLAVTEPHKVRDWLLRYGGERIVLALDVQLHDDGTPRLTTHGWTQPTDTSLFDAIEIYQDAGLRHVLCTDVSRDGAMAGPNVELYKTIVDRIPDLQLQASGGVRNIADLVALRDAGIPAAITGRAVLEGKITAEEIAAFQRSA